MSSRDFGAKERPNAYHSQVMSVATLASSDRYAQPPTVPLRRFTVEEYHRLIEQGFFAADERFELVNGYIVEKMARDPIHDAIIEILDELIRPQLPPGWRMRLQSALTTASGEPEPDIAIVPGSPRDRLTTHPRSSEAALVIEVSNSTLAFDRTEKKRDYALGGTRVYWIVNVPQQQIEIHTQPSGDRYAHSTTVTLGQVAELAIDGDHMVRLAIADLFRS